MENPADSSKVPRSLYHFVKPEKSITYQFYEVVDPFTEIKEDFLARWGFDGALWPTCLSPAEVEDWRRVAKEYAAWQKRFQKIWKKFGRPKWSPQLSRASGEDPEGESARGQGP